MEETDIQGVPKICLMMKLVVFKPKNVTNGSSNNRFTKLSSFETLVLFHISQLRLRNFSRSKPVRNPMKLSTYLPMRGVCNKKATM